jgi:methylenetetrahydrofolate dehydrogenase (NADP+) / methenyltetrahydrofolate cyclohydrolase
VTATIIDGKALAARVRDRIQGEVATLQSEHGITPGLAAVLVGDDEASKVYVGMKHRTVSRVGMHSRQIELPADTAQDDLEALVTELNEDDAIDGILVQLPLPDHLDPKRIQELIAHDKDVDALNPYTAGRLAIGDPTFLSCTPYGVVELLKDAGVELRGARVTIVGRSNLVGRPLSVILTLKGTDATVTLAHSRTKDLGGVCREADVVVAAGWHAGPGDRRHDPPGRGRDRRGHEPGGRRIAGGRRGLCRRQRGRGGDHPGSRWSGADDQGDAAAEHARGGTRPARIAAPVEPPRR